MMRNGGITTQANELCALSAPRYQNGAANTLICNAVYAYAV